MKKLLLAVTLFLVTATISFAQMKSETPHRMPMHKAHKKYTCTMDPDVVRTKPGKCPKCGMKLTAMKMKGKKMEKPMGEMKM